MQNRLLVFFLLWVPASYLLATGKNDVYEGWLKQDLVRVGVKKPQDEVRLSCNGPLLVVDGEKVVGTINPNGKFIVISSDVQSRSSKRWLQLRASRSKSGMEHDKKRLKQKFPDYSYTIKKTRQDFFALRVGPLDSLAESKEARVVFSREGYHDAFILKAKQDYHFQWLNANYDKQPLKAVILGLVRPNPNLPITYNGTRYRGMLSFVSSKDGGIQVVNRLPLETYLRGVVPSELGPSTFPELEAQKAQAVAARTYMLKNLGRYRKKGFDICDTPACQAYDGMENEHALSDQAVAETAGLVIYHGDKLIDALYTSTCGGTTEDAENVFPGNSEPYLRAKTGYLMTSSQHHLAPKPVDRKHFADVSEDLAVRALIWGFPDIPDFRGHLTGKDLSAALKHLAWVLGSGHYDGSDEVLSHAAFWRALADMTFFKDAAHNQINDADLGVLLRHYDVPETLRPFAGLAIRYDLFNRDQLGTMGHTGSILKAAAFEVLLALCDALGPEMTWVRYRLESYDDNGHLSLSRKGQERVLNLDRFDYYLTDMAQRWEFVESPHLEEWDRIYTLSAPFNARILKVKESGGVASVDRFSAFDSWLDKKSVDELEKRARRYIPGLKGIRDVRILKRSEHGRVTLLAIDADSGTHKVDGLRIRWSLGVRDNLFDILPGYRNSRLVHLTVFGRGWGHGVGMSQVGAFSLARQGWGFDKILSYYYTGVEIRPLAR